MTQPPPAGPPIPYVALYRVNAPPLEAPYTLLREGNRVVELRRGPLALTHSVPVFRFAGGAASMSLAVEQLSFPGPTYVIVQTLQQGMSFEAHTAGTKDVAEVGALLELCFPKLIAIKEFEGVVNTPGSFTMMLEGPVSLTARSPEEPSEIAQRLQDARAALGARPAEDQDRFRLAARWFRRGCETLNYVDRLLYWYVCLEIYPARGEVDVPRFVRELLSARVYPDLDPALVKERCGIGPIAGLRGEIVHRGRVGVTLLEEPVFRDRLERLEALVRTSLHLLAGLPPGAELDRWVRPTH